MIKNILNKINNFITGNSGIIKSLKREVNDVVNESNKLYHNLLILNSVTDGEIMKNYNRRALLLKKIYGLDLQKEHKDNLSLPILEVSYKIRAFAIGEYEFIMLRGGANH